MPPKIEIYLVGGAVRDRLLGLPVTDRDWLVVHGDPAFLQQQGYLQVGKDFPVFLHPDTKEEYALARKEKKNGEGYTGFCCYFSPDITLEQDLIRRDLTINAIAEDLCGNLYDPYNGIEDLKRKTLRHISPAFTEDPLRILRVARFAARFYSLGFTIAEETLSLMHSMVDNGELQTLTPERVWLETEKALDCPNPEIYFQTLQQIGALQIIFPELEPLFQQDTAQLTQSLIALNQLILDGSLPKGPIFRFALLALMLSLKIKQTTTTTQQLKCLFQRYHIPLNYQEYTLLSVQFAKEFAQTATLSTSQILDIFDQLDCWRKPERLLRLCLLYRTTLAGFGVEQQLQWQHWYQIAKAVDIQQIIKDGFRHQQIKIELYQRRIDALNHNRNCL